MYGVFVLKLGQIYSFESIIKIKFVNVQKVSIIFPVYNADKYLGECLNSIIKQSYSNWELIAVDDYSNDNSWRLLEHYQKKDSRIRIFKNRKEKGILPALQQASLHIRGTLVTRMDADDWMPEYKIETMIKEVRPKVIVTGLVQYFTDEGEMGQGYLKYENWMNEVLLSQNPWSYSKQRIHVPSNAAYDGIGDGGLTDMEMRWAIA